MREYIVSWTLAQAAVALGPVCEGTLNGSIVALPVNRDVESKIEHGVAGEGQLLSILGE